MVKLISSLLILLLLCIPTVGNTQTDVSVLMQSYHFQNEQGYNNDNYGIIGKTYNGKSFYTYGAFQNSEDNLSIFLGKGRTFGDGDFKTSISLGLVSGYERSDVLPMIVGTIYLWDRLDLHFTPDPVNDSIVISFGIKILEF